MWDNLFIHSQASTHGCTIVVWDMWFPSTHYNWINYLPIMGLNLSQTNKRGACCQHNGNIHSNSSVKFSQKYTRHPAHSYRYFLSIFGLHQLQTKRISDTIFLSLPSWIPNMMGLRSYCLALEHNMGEIHDENMLPIVIYIGHFYMEI